MLLEIKIKDFAIIDDLYIGFSDGMNVLTGETGAGKSIIIDAVNLILGARGSADYIRTGCKEAKIEALFDISDNSAIQIALNELGYEASDSLIVKRIISPAKSKVVINDSLSTVNTLSSLLPALINVYGQNEHQELLNREMHLKTLDTFGGHYHLLNDYKKNYYSLKEVDQKLAKLKKAAANRDKEIDFINYQLSEINAANLNKDAEAELKKEKEILTNREAIHETCAYGFENLYSKTGSVSACLNEILLRLNKVKALDNSFENYHNEIKNALYSLEDAAIFFRDYPGKLDFSNTSIDEVEARLNVISGMKKKYGGSIENVLKTKGELEKNLKELKNITENCEALEEKQVKLKKQTLELAGKLSKKRYESANRLSKKLVSELKTLGMINACFNTKFSELANLTETGAEEVEFYFSANPGEDFKPLRKVASGGELSRIMLALKNVIRDKDRPATLIFDEVDSGIGGKAAHIVGAKLKTLSLSNQVICVTHLSQIASYADSHYHVAKEQKHGRTVTAVGRLDMGERIEEVARLLSGEAVTEYGLKHAEDMITKNSKRGIN